MICGGHSGPPPIEIVERRTAKLLRRADRHALVWHTVAVGVVDGRQVFAPSALWVLS